MRDPPRSTLRALLLTVCAVHCAYGFRVLDSSADPKASTPAVFQPYVKGGAGYYGDPLNPDPERVNEGAPFSPDTPRVYQFGSPKQNCPSMVGPIQEEEYYCRGREYGYCDRRSGLCVCNQGYTGLDCTDCKPAYFRKGSLCYPKKSCPNDCSRAGVCNYETGACTCALNRSGDDCTKLVCSFDPKCTSCTATACLSCLEGFFVEPSTQKCVSCKTYDPRCLVCDNARCIQCADPILNSIRRSGARNVDEPLPADELTREFSFQFAFGSQDPRVFDEAEVFELLPVTTTKFLNDVSVACTQGLRSDASWTCQPNRVSHRVCGHAGVFSFTSPVYAVPESSQSILLTVQRSGGGMGAASVSYDIQHITTSAQDVSPTAFYTSSQTLQFASGVVNMSFLLTIHEDRQVEPSETFRVVLRSPSDGSSLGNQRLAHVTIVDNDAPLTDATLTYVVPSSGTTLEKGGAAGDVLSFQVQAVLGDGSAKKTGGDLLLMESYVADETEFDAPASSLYRSKVVGSPTDLANGLYSVAWLRRHAGTYTVSVYVLYAGGLLGDYFADAWLSGTPIVSRVDRQINFSWNTGSILPGASDFVGVRWSGRLQPKATGDTTVFVDCDDHVRLWIGDTLLIDRWSLENDGGVQAQATIYLDATQFYVIQIEYRDLTGDARIALSWSAAGLPKEIIPPSSLYTAQHIRGSPFANIVISPALASHASTSYLQGIFSTIAGTPLTLQLFPVDVYGNARNVFDAKLDAYQATLSLLTDQSLGGVGSKTVDCEISWRSERALFTVMCVPFVSGAHNLNVYVNSQLLVGSPFAVAVQPNRMHPARSVLSGAGLTLGRVAGTATTISLETRDLHNNRIFASSGPTVLLTVRAIHATQAGVIDLGSVVDNGDGTYTFTYTPRFAGSYLIHVTQNDAPIHNAPYSVTVVPNIAVGFTSVATGAGLSGATTNIQSAFQIQSRDANSNDLTAGSGTVYQVILEHPTKGNVTGICTDLLTSKYACTYTPKYVGASKLHVGLVRGAVFSPIIGSPFTVPVVAGPALGSLSFARGGALVSSVAGQPVTFTVVVRDAFDNDKQNAGTETLNVAFVGPAPSTTTVPVANTGLVIVYNGDGTYSVSYTLTTKGAYKLQVTLNGVAVLGSPFAMYTYPASASHKTTTIDLVSPTAPPYYAGAPIVTRITTRDAFGNVLESGGSLFLLDTALSNASLIANPPARVVDEAAGTYVVQFTPTAALRYSLAPRILYPGGLNGTYYGNPDSVGPAKLQRIDATVDWDFGGISPVETDDRETFSIRWDGFVLPKYSELYTIYATVTGGMRCQIGSRELFGSLWPSATNAHAYEQISLVANQLVSLRMYFSKPRLFRNASVRVEWESLSQPRQVIPSSRLFTAWAFTDNVPPVNVLPDIASSASFTADFPRGSFAEPNTVTATAGKPLVYYVTARDRFGNQRRQGGDRITILFPQLPDGADIVPAVVDLGNAVYEITIVPTLRGAFSMVVAATRLSDDIHSGTGTDSLVERLRPFFIRQSPFTLRVLPDAPLATASTLVPGEGISSAIAGVASSFVVELRDLHGNRIQQTIPTEKLLVRLRQIATPAVYYDGEHGDAVNGYLRVNYTAIVSGTYEILLAVLDTGNIVQKTTSLQVDPNLASALTSSASSGSGLGPQVQANTRLSFQLDLRDAYGNPLARGGNDLVVLLRGPAVVYGDIVDLQNGQYLVQYSLPLPGTYEMETTLANSGVGLVGSYFETTRVSMARAIQWIDPRLEFDWLANETMRNYPRIQWRGFLKPLYTEAYTLRLSVFPFAAVYIDNQPIIDAINMDAITGDAHVDMDGHVELVAGRLHRIVVEYRSPSRRDVRGSLRLQWHSARQPMEIIPTQAFRPDGQEIPPRFTLVAV